LDERAGQEFLALLWRATSSDDAPEVVLIAGLAHDITTQTNAGIS